MVADRAVEAMLERERALFVQRNPRSQALAAESGRYWLHGVPMQWMVDWPTPFPLTLAEAKGISLTDADGNTYLDFCLGDTGAMFGHSPGPVTETLARQGAKGLTTMLPSEDAAAVGELLADRFGLPFWQVTATASDANRSILRWCRAVTGRPKILVFNGCYHGAVDDTFLTIRDGRAVADPGLIGSGFDPANVAKVIEFNDVAALEEALAPGDVACVLAEPVMTNCGMVLPEPGYHAALRRLTRETGTLLVIDETHCMSSGPGGYTREYGLDPDAIVLGKPIAGGVPAAVYGVSDELAGRIAAFLQTRQPGHSGIGTTLSGSAIQIALMRRVLETYFTVQAFVPMVELAKRLEAGIAALIASHGAPWHVVRVGARVEFMCVPKRPRNGGEAKRAIHRPVDSAVHLYLLNRGLLVTPFHNMLLIAPATTAADVDALLAGLDKCLGELTSSQNGA
ncbi:MAG: aspartate aminotransferase family protein [Parvibaculaceae bacterium]